MFAKLAAILSIAALVAAAPFEIEQRAAATPYTGEITHYDVGLGSCGKTSTAGQAVVALAVPMMKNGANPNKNPLCGQTIEIVYQGKTTDATIVDTCQACAMDDVDMSNSLFTTVAPQGNGRVHGVTWRFKSTATGLRP